MQQKTALRADTLCQSITVAVALAIVCRVVAFGRGIYLARALEPEELGTWALMANAIQVLAFVCTLGLPNAMARYTERHRLQGALGSFCLGALARTLAVAAPICLIGWIFWQPTGRLLFAEAASRSAVWISVSAILATVLLTVAQSVLHGLRLFRANSLFDLAQNLAFLAMAMLLVACWRSDALAAAWANLAATLLVAAGIGWWLRHALRNAPADNAAASRTNICWSPIWAFSLGAWSAGSLQALGRVVDRYMLLHLSSASTPETLDHIGQYFIASKLGQPLSAVAGVLSMALLPHAVKLWEGGRRAEVAEMVSITAILASLLMTFGGAVLIAGKFVLIELVTGRAAPLAGAVLVPVLVTIIAVSQHYILRTYLMCDERAWAVSGVWLAALLVNVGLNLLFIQRCGLLGATWATLISSALAVALVALLAARSGMPIRPRLIGNLLLPAALLLPNWAMLLSLTFVAASVLFSQLVLSDVEKRWINQWCADRFRPYFIGRLGHILAPQPSSPVRCLS